MTRRTVKVPRNAIDRSVDRNRKIQACRGVYGAKSVAEHFDVSRKHVYELWKEDLDDLDLGVEPPNIYVNNLSSEVLYEEAVILCGHRSLSISGAAEQLGTSTENLTKVLRRGPTGLEIIERDQEAVKAWKRGRTDPRGSFSALDRSGWPLNI